MYRKRLLTWLRLSKIANMGTQKTKTASIAYMGMVKQENFMVLFSLIADQRLTCPSQICLGEEAQ